jgi:sulfur carrier protein ThiS
MDKELAKLVLKDVEEDILKDMAIFTQDKRTLKEFIKAIFTRFENFLIEYNKQIVNTSHKRTKILNRIKNG